MLIAIFFLTLIDTIVHVDLIGFVPNELKSFLNIGKIGISDLFNLLFIVFEILSIFKNMILCELPIPKKLQEFLQKALDEFTSELSKK